MDTGQRGSSLSSWSGKGAGLAKSTFVSLFLVLGAAVVGLAVVRMSATTALLAAAGVVLIWLLVQLIEVPFYFAVFCIIALQEVEITPGSRLEIFENYKVPGVPSVLEIALVLLVTCFLVKYFVRREEDWVRIFQMPVFLFLALYCLSYTMGVGSENNDILIKEDSKKFLFPVLFFLCSVNVLNTPRKILHLAWFAVAVTSLKVYLGILSYLQGTGFAYGDANVVFVETADLIMVVTVLVASFSMLLYRKTTWRMVLYLMLVVAPLVFALVYSNRRNAWLGIMLALSLLFVITPRRLKFRAGMIVACAGLGALCMISVSIALRGLPSGQDLKQRFASISDRSDKSNEAHVNEWEVTIEALEEHPIRGLGFGSEHAPVPGDDTINRHTVHNGFLMLYMKMGVGAVLLFLWCLIRYFRLGVRKPAAASAPPDPLRVGLFATFAYWLVTLNVAPCWWYYRETCMMALVAAIVIRLSLLAQSDALPTTPVPSSNDKGASAP